jgi:hypothetical protein
MNQVVECLLSKLKALSSTPSAAKKKKKKNSHYTAIKIFLFCKFFSFLFFSFFVVLGYELRVYTLSHSTSPLFFDRFSEIGSCELFAWADFEPVSS